MDFTVLLPLLFPEYYLFCTSPIPHPITQPHSWQQENSRQASVWITSVWTVLFSQPLVKLPAFGEAISFYDNAWREAGAWEQVRGLGYIFVFHRVVEILFVTTKWAHYLSWQSWRRHCNRNIYCVSWRTEICLCCLFHLCLAGFIFKTVGEKIGREDGKTLLKGKKTT